MKRVFCILSFLIFASVTIKSQVVLSADGPGDTYELINSVFANPGKNVVEVPDCNHDDFDHIDEIYDNDLNKNVFRFHLHVEKDNDRCKKFDRQRNEIKTYKDSPENLKATIGEVVEYKWKFKLSDSFKPSKSFTHIHQIKAVGGPYASIPMISLTLRKANPDRLELRYTSTKNQKTIKKADLEAFKGRWVEVTEVIKYGDIGSYYIKIKRISDNKELFSYTNSSISTWQSGAEFARPKWGVYRSLKDKENLRNEIISFADFSIREKNYLLANYQFKWEEKNTTLRGCPIKKEVVLKGIKSKKYNSVGMYDYNGQNIPIDKLVTEDRLDVSSLSKGLYFIVYKKDETIMKLLNCFVN